MKNSWFCLKSIEHPEQEQRVFQNLEFEYLPLTPNEDQLKIVKAQIYSMKLKEEELKKKNVDVQKIKEKDSRQIMSNFMIEKEEAQRNFNESFKEEELKKCFSDFEV